MGDLPSTPDSKKTKTFADNSTHTARAVIRTGYNVATREYCVEGKAISESSNPGATTSSWVGTLHEGELALVNIDITAIRQAYQRRNSQQVIDFFVLATPARDSTPTAATTPYECPHPCLGGKSHTQFLKTHARVVKHYNYFLYGEHSFTHGTSNWTAMTKAYFQVPSDVDLEGNWWAAVISELALDLTEEQVDAIEEDESSSGGD